MSDTMTTEQGAGLALLRVPFPPHQISKLPKPTKAQTDAVKENFKVGKRCAICSGWHHPDVVHLDYVGHAAATDRLLDADSGWTWEPVALGPDGLPAFDKTGGLWIRLTVCGVTRLGYGNAASKPNADPGSREKECIGDALRNAMMRFGGALDLWHKGVLHLVGEDDDDGAPGKQPADAGMLPTYLHDWLQAIAGAGDDEYEAIVTDGLSAATEVKDREAFIAIRAAGKKRQEATA